MAIENEWRGSGRSSCRPCANQGYERYRNYELLGQRLEAALLPISDSFSFPNALALAVAPSERRGFGFLMGFSPIDCCTIL